MTKYALSLFLAGGALCLFAIQTPAAAVRSVAGTTAKTLPRNDDGSTGAVPIGFTVNFFGVTKSTLFVNNNGNVTFNSALGQYTPQGIASSVTQPMIAPFFADVDTGGSASGVVQYGNGTLCGRQVFGVNWINVGYFPSRTDKLNSFQLLMIDRADTGTGNFDIEINYDKIQWETGGASGGQNGLGGTSAAAGYTNGQSGSARVSFQFPGSLVNGALLDSGPNALSKGKQAANTAGRYHFFVRNGQVTNVTVVQNKGKATEISDKVKAYLPLRTVFDSSDGSFDGSILLIRSDSFIKRDAGTSTSGTEACLDETNVQTVTTTVKGPVLTPITIVFSQLPSGANVLNATGKTGSGRPYITIPGSTLEAGQSLRFDVSMTNPGRLSTGAFYKSNNVQMKVYGGAFNPSGF